MRQHIELLGFAAFCGGDGAFAALCFYFGGEDFVGYGVAGALEGSPHVPACDGAVGAPALAEGQKFLGLVLLAVSYGPTLLHSEVVDGEDVGAAEIEDEEHLDGPGADAADGVQALD